MKLFAALYLLALALVAIGLGQPDDLPLVVEATPASAPCAALPNPCDTIDCSKPPVKGPMDWPDTYLDQRMFS